MATLKLRNVRNLCYINVVLQVLYKNVDFRYFICKKIYFKNDKDQSIYNSLYLLFSGAGIVTDAENLRSVLGNHYNLVLFNDGSMNDSQEVLLALLNCIKTEISLRNESYDYVLGLFQFFLTASQNYINDTLICLGSPSETSGLVG